MRLLIIEDDRNQADLLARLIKRKTNGGLDIISAETFESGLQAVKAENPDVILVDLLLPDSRPWQKTIMRLSELTKPYIVVTAAEDKNLVRTAAFVAGADNVFFKPFCTTVTEHLISAFTAASLRQQARELAKKAGSIQKAIKEVLNDDAI